MLDRESKRNLPSVADHMCTWFREKSHLIAVAYSACSAAGTPGAQDCLCGSSEEIAAPRDASAARSSERPQGEDVYSIEQVTTFEEFRRLKEAWNALLREGTRHKPYREHDWFELWFTHFEAGVELSIFLVKRDQKIEAIFPFVLKNKKCKGLSIRQLEFPGSVGAAMRTPIFRDLDASQKEAILRSLFRFLARSVKWDLLRLTFLPGEDFDLETLDRVLSADSLTYKERAWFGDWYLDGIDFTGEQYLASRISHVRKNIKRFAKQFGHDGGMKLEIVTGGDDETIDRWMDHFHAVYKKSWKEWEAHSTFDRALAKMARDRGYLRLGLLFVHDNPVAAQFWLVCNRKAYVAKIVYDEQLKKFSPGVTLTAAMSTHVIDNDKVEEIDFQFGDDAYKKDWAPKRRERKNVLIFNRHSLRGWLLGYVIPKVGLIMRGNRVLRPARKVILKILRVD